jgi:hypothetical protein
MVGVPRQKRRKSRGALSKDYARTIKPKVAQHYQEIIRFGAVYAAAWLRRPRSKHQAHLSDLLPTADNAKEIAAEAFKKLLSGERRDWDGEPETLHQAIGSCINSILSSRLSRNDNLSTAPIDATKVDWFYGDADREDPYLEPAEEIANRHSKVKIIRRLLPADNYDVEAQILSAMILHRAFNVDVIAALTGMSERHISDAFVRLAAYVQTDEFAERSNNVFGASFTSVALPARQRTQAIPRLSKRAAVAAVPLFASGLAIGLSTRQLTEATGLKTEKLYESVRVGAPRAQARKKEMLEIISRVASWAGGKAQAMAWCRAEPIPAFGGRTAESLVKSGQAPALRDYLDHIAMGGFA